MKPLILIVLDGWGINPRTEGNAQARAKMPFINKIFAEYPHAQLETSGLSVGLPEGQMGNSEVGHLTMGAGRIVYQELTRIDREIETGGFFKNKTLLDAIAAIKKGGGALHLMGLVSDGGVHSHINHLFALLAMAKQKGMDKVFIHAFLDGRDTPPRSGKGYIENLQAHLDKTGIGRIATITGRYYAMDRDNRWERVEKAYKALAQGKGERFANSPIEAITEAYQKGETDEFVMPTVITNNNKPVATIKNGDGIIFFNFRADRARELTRTLTQEDFKWFNRGQKIKLSGYVCLAEYDATFNLSVAFLPQSLKNILAEIFSNNKIKQLRIAETEKYAHVTFFFNGGVEKPFPLEDMVLIPSPKEVPTYDKKPEMSAYLVTEELVKRIKSGGYQFILVNYANGDMVGHTGVMDAAVKACEVINECLERVVKTGGENGWIVLITSDHGNIEQMIDYNTKEPHTAHTTNLVPFVLIDGERKNMSLRNGGLSDVAPTILELMGIEKPVEMTGRSLMKK
ncbi:MAG: 2,3-bisphosphoglycerate-independent phosphoglycerate mutase [Deltaproteobacteria bacterium]|nr:2,3-bisphosphoglycerate-independent phosphoglycerate mutase [Deltaproteobacteria bacterium]